MAGVAGFNIILHAPLTGKSNKELNKAANNLVKTAMQQGDAENANNLVGNIDYVKQSNWAHCVAILSACDIPRQHSVSCPPQFVLLDAQDESVEIFVESCE